MTDKQTNESYIAELQLTVREFLSIRAQMHPFYSIIRASDPHTLLDVKEGLRDP
eukprot:CAMPEP_0197037306 /NCGR_PEP_ID=MMETSP1384-20130603/14550_1 /TAXON_ID=29189 /ORGANISM="Ammonia sp." /LENGTH=53 /DNA_ID=CAMNT_0042467589 /DNA_START=1 /DNA_END=162 /DNA_ORIENTATION=-